MILGSRRIPAIAPVTVRGRAGTGLKCGTYQGD